MHWFINVPKIWKILLWSIHSNTIWIKFEISQQQIMQTENSQLINNSSKNIDAGVLFWAREREMQAKKIWERNLNI